MSRPTPAGPGTAGLPSIRARLGRLMIIWSMVWVVAGSFSVLLSVQHEADELLDDTMHASAQVMTALLGPNLEALPPSMSVEGRVARLPEERFAWQVVGPDGQVLLRSPSAPEMPWSPTPTAGYFDIEGWRILGEAMAHGGRMLYVSQSREERHEARLEIALGTALPALGVGLLAYLTLGAKVQHELEPLQRLSDRLDRHDPTQAGAGLGPAERAELQPVHHAIDALGQRLAHQLAQERVFSAHAAHALRTPLAGMDVQLAVALREAPPELRPRLTRVREAGRRLQSVISALLLLFRGGGGNEPVIRAVDVAALLARWPVDRLTVTVPPGLVVRAEPDLLAAALINLLDNAVRHGARQVWLSQPAPGVLRLVDDGPGVPAAQRERLRQTLQGELGRDEPRDYRADTERGQGTGLGLQLVALVARQHGGELRLPEPADGEGFVVELAWDAPDDAQAPAA